MTAKATIANITDEGFQAMQFGSPANFITAGGYIDTLLTRASNWAQVRVLAANYAVAGTSGFAFDCLARAETAYVCQELWKRRSVFLDASANLALSDDKRAQMIQQAIDNAADAQCDANYWIGEAQRFYGLDPTADLGGTGISTGYTETGRFPQTSLQPMNVETS